MIKRFLFSFITLFAVWIMLNNTLDIINLIIGVLVSIFITLIFYSNTKVYKDIKNTPKAFIYTVLYILIFIKELIKSNLDVAFRVVSPSLPINPGIVKVKTKLKSETGRLILANSITLTPGTLTVDIKDEYIFIHWIDVTSTDINIATENIVNTFEKYLIEIYG